MQYVEVSDLLGIFFSDLTNTKLIEAINRKESLQGCSKSGNANNHFKYGSINAKFHLTWFNILAEWNDHGNN